MHGLPRLERLWYGLMREEKDRGLVNPFVLVFSRPFEGGLVCPRLQHLKLPRVVLTHDASAVCLKRALSERDARGRRLKRIGPSGFMIQAGDWPAIEPLREFVDEIY